MTECSGGVECESWQIMQNARKEAGLQRRMALEPGVEIRKDFLDFT
jgi:hypothetical protein